MSVPVVAIGAAGTAAGAGAVAGGYDASHVASNPAPETTAVDFQVMTATTLILSFGFSGPSL